VGGLVRLSAATASPPSSARPVAGCRRLCHNRAVGAGHKEESMAKGQMRNNKEAKKPKSDKPKNSVSDYKKSQGATGQALNPPGKKS
jgi:hypothetical protein